MRGVYTKNYTWGANFEVFWTTIGEGHATSQMMEPYTFQQLIIIDLRDRIEKEE